VSRLPSYIYNILDEGNATINIGPNIIDKWPDALNVSKPGMEQITLAQEHARTYNRDIYFWERVATDAGSKELGPPMDPSKFRQEIYYQLGHALDDCLAITTNPEYRKKWEKDRDDIPPDQVQRLKYYLNPVNYAGAGEVCACYLSDIMGSTADTEVDKYFPRCKIWIKEKLESEEAKRSSLAKKNTGKEASEKKTAVMSYLGNTRGGAKKGQEEPKKKEQHVIRFMR